jgi:hypothetical protein
MSGADVRVKQVPGTYRLLGPYVDVALVEGRVPRDTGRALAGHGLWQDARHWGRVLVRDIGQPRVADRPCNAARSMREVTGNARDTIPELFCPGAGLVDPSG